MPVETETLFFEPTGDLEMDYCAFCEINDQYDLEEIINGIDNNEIHTTSNITTYAEAAHATLGQEEKTKSAMKPIKSIDVEKATPVFTNPISSSATSPHVLQKLISRTTISIRNLSYCLNRRDITPLCRAIPYCLSLTRISLTGCGLTEYSYKLLIAAIFKSSSIHTLVVDFNPGDLFKDPTVNYKKDLNEVFVTPLDFRGTTLKRCQEYDPTIDWVTGQKSLRPAKFQSLIAHASAGKSKPSTKRGINSLSVDTISEKIPLPIIEGWSAALMAGLQVLSLRGNGITDSEIRVLCTMLVTHSNLQSLSLFGNQITSLGAIMLADTLTVNVKLVALDLGQNQIGDEGAVALASVFLTYEGTYEDVLAARKRHALQYVLDAYKADHGGRYPHVLTSQYLSLGFGNKEDLTPPVNGFIFPSYLDFAAYRIAKLAETLTLKRLQEFGMEISISSKASIKDLIVEKKGSPDVAKGRKGAAMEAILEPPKPALSIDGDIIRMVDDPSDPQMAHLVHQITVAVSGSGIAQANAREYVAQHSRYKIPSNITLQVLHLSQNPLITEQGAKKIVNLFKFPEFSVESVLLKFVEACQTHHISVLPEKPQSPSYSSAASKSTKVKLSVSGNIFAAITPALGQVIPTDTSDEEAMERPAINAAAIGKEMQQIIMNSNMAWYLSTKNVAKDYIPAVSKLQSMSIENSVIPSDVVRQLRKIFTLRVKRLNLGKSSSS